MNPLSINPGGEWSPRQAEAVSRALAPELEARGLKLRTLGVNGHPKRVALQLLCAKHDCVVKPDSACPVCVNDSTRLIRRIS